MSIFSFLGFKKNQNTVNNSIETEIPQVIIKEFDSLAQGNFRYFTESYIKHKSFNPFAICYAKDNIEMIIVDDPISNNILIYEKVQKMLNQKWIANEVNRTCLVYLGEYHSPNFPNGITDVFVFEFNDKRIAKTLIMNYPVIVLDSVLRFGKSFCITQEKNFK